MIGRPLHTFVNADWIVVRPFFLVYYKYHIGISYCGVYPFWSDEQKDRFENALAEKVKNKKPPSFPNGFVSFVILTKEGTKSAKTDASFVSMT